MSPSRYAGLGGLGSSDRVGAMSKQATLEATWALGPPKPFVRIKRSREQFESDDRIAVVDLFCGLGGFSEGCKKAGHSIVLAVDFCAALLDAHCSNHPDCTHVCMELGPDTEERLTSIIREALPAASKWHLHASPPCQLLSTLRQMKKAMDINEGLRLVHWYLLLVKKLAPVCTVHSPLRKLPLDGIKAGDSRTASSQFQS